MNFNELDASSLSTISFRSILQYFQSYDWKLLDPAPFDDIVIMRKEIEGSEEEILIPSDQTFVDFQERIFEACCKFAKLEHKRIDDIFTDLLSQGSDILRLRISGVNVQRGLISFLDEMNVKEGLKKILSSIACQVLDPRPFYKKLHRGESEQLIRNCRIGVPESGSFVIKFYFPVLESHCMPKASLEKEKPFARHVAEQLMISLQNLTTSIEEKNLTTSQCSLNANFCFGLVEMNPVENLNDLDFQIFWSEEIPADKNVPNKIIIQNNYMTKISKIGEHLKPRQETTQNDFIGKITGLYGSENEQGEVEGDITLALLVDEESKKAKAYLKAPFYSQACDAHKTGKYIQISGQLREKPRLSILEEISNFEVISTTLQ